MVSKAWILGWAWAVPVSLTWSQDLQEVETTSNERHLTPMTVVDPPGFELAESDQVEAEFLNRDGGATKIEEAIFASDDVPLPIPAKYEASENGDVLVSPASGNPYFIGFVAGPYYPPAGERIDPELLSQAHSEFQDGRPANEVFGFVMFEKRITPERVAELERLGVRVLDFHPHYSLRTAIPVNAIEAVADLSYVRWVGTARGWQKIHPRLLEELSVAQPNAPLDVFINLHDTDVSEASTTEPVGTMSSISKGTVVTEVHPELLGARMQSNGWQQRGLEAIGVEVEEYIASVDTFRARLYPASLEMLLAQDNVQFVELNVPETLAHDESTPMINADRVRLSYDGNNTAVTLGIIDSGYNFSHTGLNHIDGWGWDYTGSVGGAWTDLCEHGSHVAGSILGLPISSLAGYTGVVPLVADSPSQRLFQVKYFGDTCASSGTAHSTLYDRFENDLNDGTNISPRPVAINNSWRASGVGWVGTETNARILDDQVWNFSQLYVFAAGNEGPGASTIGLPSVAKNAFTVGSVVDYRSSTVGDPGELWTSSSRGPAGDNRWKPNVVAPGRLIRSVDANSGSGYKDLSGTSMAAPHVTGVAGQMADAYSWMRYAPHRMASVMMATALTKNDTTISSPSASHLDTYGTGRVEAYRNIFGSSGFGWNNWGFNLSGSGWTYADFTVNTGATRLIVCMTYHEDNASSGASKALVNDWDLWLDQEPIDPAGNTGEWFAQQSTVDNTEIRILNNPQVGSWRWKVWPDSVSGSGRVSVTVSVIYDDTTPNGGLSITANDTCVAPNQNVEFTATASNPDYIASAVFLDSTSSGDSLQASTTTLKDGAVTNLMDNQHGGRDVLLGNLYPGTTRSAKWTTRWATEGVKTFAVNARSDNWVDRNVSINVTVDGTDPGLATNLKSSTHTAGVWDNNPNITYTWTNPVDNVSGLDGFGIATTTNAPGLPGAVKDIESVTSYSESLTTSNSAYYFNLRSVDNCGNWDGQAASTGGYLIDTIDPTGASNLKSNTHKVGESNCDATIRVNWNSATDLHSGLAGYRGIFNSSPNTNPTGSLNIGAGATNFQQTLSTGQWYFHLRSQDVAGNWGPTVHVGPFTIDTDPVKIYCTPKVTSCATLPLIGSSGQPKASQNSGFKIFCDNTKAKKTGILVYTNAGPGAFPFQGGILCINPAPLKRSTVLADVQGTGNNCNGRLEIDMSAFAAGLLGGNPLPDLRNPGAEINAQFWGRDTIGNGSLLSNGLQYTVCP